MSKIVHWHINTGHKPGTPPYPDKDAVYIYRTGCAKELLSTDREQYELTQFRDRINTITCKPCKVWATHYFKQNINTDGYYYYPSVPTNSNKEKDQL